MSEPDFRSAPDAWLMPKELVLVFLIGKARDVVGVAGENPDALERAAFFGDAGVRRTLRIPAGNSGCAAVGGAQIQE